MHWFFLSPKSALCEALLYIQMNKIITNWWLLFNLKLHCVLDIYFLYVHFNLWMMALFKDGWMRRAKEELRSRRVKVFFQFFFHCQSKLWKHTFVVLGLWLAQCGQTLWNGKDIKKWWKKVEKDANKHWADTEECDRMSEDGTDEKRVLKGDKVLKVPRSLLFELSQAWECEFELVTFIKGLSALSGVLIGLFILKIT